MAGAAAEQAGFAHAHAGADLLHQRGRPVEHAQAAADQQVQRVGRLAGLEQRAAAWQAKRHHVRGQRAAGRRVQPGEQGMGKQQVVGGGASHRADARAAM
ncbi:MAG: hypothetical protein ABT19_09585 [Rhodanobacter sp. SCN 68-63]|nr:MAG: hypothetical protein ABT19_09585 [Rhodanobacter sp. SCN 68-63]